MYLWLLMLIFAPQNIQIGLASIHSLIFSRVKSLKKLKQLTVIDALSTAMDTDQGLGKCQSLKLMKSSTTTIF